MEKKTLSILCATDDNYAPYCGVMLTSFLENHRSFHTEVYVIVKNRLNEEARLKSLEASYNVRIHPVVFTFGEIFEQYQSDNRWSVETFYRLLAAKLLPDCMDKVLYLDCDMIVVGDVSTLFDMNIEGCSALVCSDVPYEETDPQRLGYERCYGYFNAGMVLINLRYWRENKVSDDAIATLKEWKKGWIYCDQDLLNVVLHDTKRFVGIEYNFILHYLSPKLFGQLDIELKRAVAECKPRIIHYTYPKPWDIMSYRYPYVEKWDEYRNLSLWKNTERYKMQKKKFIIDFVKRYILWPLHIEFHHIRPSKEWQRMKNLAE